MKMKTLLLIDGHAMIHRAFHALPPMSSQDGTPTNAIYGFFMMFHKAFVDFQPSHVVVCFDTPTPTFRKELFDGYQAKRPPLDDTLRPQIPFIKELLDAGGIKRSEKPGFEADDLIGTLATQYKKDMDRVLILTGDRDILQLVDENVFVILPQKGLSTIKLYNEEEVRLKFDIEAKQIPDYKALAGDASDNYGIAKGIGPKTAAQLLHQFKSIEDMLANTDKVEKLKIRTTLEECKESIILFKKIATIVKDVEIDVPPQSAEYHGFQEPMKDNLRKLQLFSLTKKLFEGTTILPASAQPKKEEKKPETSPQLDLFGV